MKLSDVTTAKTKRHPAMVDRFWKQIAKSSNGCWEWLGAKWKSGYGQIKVLGKRWKAHRISFLIEHGFLDESLCVLHKCDNRACVRPDHLYQGTKTDNSRDCVDRGRTAKGTKIALAKLTDEIVEKMRSQYSTRTAMSLAEEHNVSYATACHAIYGQTWKHVKTKAPSKYFVSNQHV